MNWGKGIIGGMIIFMLFIIGMSIFMFNAPADEYDHNYYEKGLNYTKDYDLEEQVTKDHAQPVIKQQNGEIILSFKEPLTGTIKFVRPSNKSQDKAFAINSGADKQVILPLKDIAAGQWQLIISWKSNSKNYLYKQEFFINGH
jgi:hypothetical protein